MDFKKGIQGIFDFVRNGFTKHHTHDTLEILEQQKQRYEAYAEAVTTVQQSKDDGRFEDDYFDPAGRRADRLKLYMEANDPFFLVEDFDAFLTDDKTEDVFAKHGRSPRDDRFPMSDKVMQSFHIIAPLIPKDEVQDMVDVIGNSAVFKTAMETTLEKKGDVAYGFSEMAVDLSAEERIGLFKALDRNELLQDALAISKPEAIAHYLTATFDGVDDETMIDVVTGSNALMRVVADDKLHRAFTSHEADERLEMLEQFAHGGTKRDPSVDGDDLRM